MMTLSESDEGKSHSYKSLFQPLSIGDLQLDNRFVLAPLVNNYAGEDGRATEKFLDFYLARARGGLGLIILGATYVHEDGQGFQNQLGLHRDDLVGPLRDFVREVSSHCPVIVQLSLKFPDRNPEEFSESEIEKYIDAYAQGARRAREAGFDGVELHSCHDYFINQFLSPYTNHRDDQYGGSLNDRMRVAVDTLHAVKEQAGEEMVVGCRINGDEFVEGGLKLSDSTTIGNRLAKEGADYISVTGGLGETQYRMSPPMEVERGSLLSLAEGMKKRVDVPVIGVGRIDRPETFLEGVDRGIDMLAAARAFISDPDFVSKLDIGEEEEIRPCIACNYCLWELHKDEGIKCVVNPYLGDELEKISRAPDPKRVMVIGGGPGGLQAAAVAAKRGHEVELYEKSSRLGGKVLAGMRPPHKEPLDDFLHYLISENEREGVTLNLNREVDRHLISSDDPDVVIVATGSVPITPEVPGIQSENVSFAEDVLNSSPPSSGDYLVVGGGLVGLETAEFIAEGGANVEVIEMLDEIGEDLPPVRRMIVLKNIENRDITVRTNTRLEKIESLDGSDVRVKVNSAQGSEELGLFDSVILACGYSSNDALVDELEGWRGKNFLIHTVGDCKEPRTLYEAVSEGQEIAKNI